MDAVEATRIVKKYFEEAHGAYGAIQFLVEGVSPEPDGRWVVLCSFFRGLAAVERTYYRATVRQDGGIDSVQTVASSTGLAAGS
jgi:hypothetical protein